jgi:hypothetical protein
LTEVFTESKELVGVRLLTLEIATLIEVKGVF